MKKRAYGTGFVEKLKNGYRWRLTRNGRSTTGVVWPTEALATAELDRVVADSAFVPAAPMPRSQRGNGTATIHRQPHRPRMPATKKAFVQPAAVEAAAIPDYTDAEIAAAERAIDRAGKRWRRGAGGKRRCVPCDGTGIDDRPGPGKGSACLNCWGGGA